VGDVGRAAGDQPRVFLALDFRAHESRSRHPYTSRPSSHAASARSFARPVAFLFRISSARPITGISTPPTRVIVRAAHASSNSTPSIDVSTRSEEHTSELQSRGHLVCRLPLEKKKIPADTDLTIQRDRRRDRKRLLTSPPRE